MSTETPATTQTATKRESVPEVAFTTFTENFEFAPRTVTRKPGAGRKRSDYMVALDALLKDHFASGKPAALECIAEEPKVAALEKKINQSATFVNVGIKFGAYLPSKKKGHVLVTFMVVERKVRPRKPKANVPAQEN